MTPPRPALAAAVCAACFIGAAEAATYSGSLSDPTNTALVGSDLGSAGFADDSTIANNVALYGFVVPVASQITVTSTGFVAGGVDPYFTLFKGAGGSATFFGSKYAQAFSTGGDFVYTAALTAGTYQLALGAFANQSFAENGGGTLADGFIGLGESYSLGNGRYALDVTLNAGGGVTPVPEPATVTLLVAGLMALGANARSRRAESGPSRG